MLEWRAQRLDRQEQNQENQSNNQQYPKADRVVRTNDLSALGIKDVTKDRG